MRAMDELQSQGLFRKLKVTCVPLMGNTALTASSSSTVASLLADLLQTLRDAQGSGSILKPSLISYIFMPLSTLLRRNTSAMIPDLVLERVLLVIAILCESWWWDCDVAIWEQLFMLCGSVVGGIEGKGKGKLRDEEAKTAATICLWALLRKRTEEDNPFAIKQNDSARERLAVLVRHAQSTKFIPILGQTLDSLLGTATSAHLPLQYLSLDVLNVLIDVYLPDHFVPSVLPGIVSTMNKIILGIPASKRWANGDTIVRALAVMQSAILRSVGDDVCIREGAVQRLDRLEDLAELVESPQPPEVPPADARPYATTRTPAWLRGTASQLHIALNTLTPLVSHPNPSALRAASGFASSLLAHTTLTLPHSQPLLLSFLLSLSTSSIDSVAEAARAALRRLLTPPSAPRRALLQVLVQTARDSLSALPRLLLSHADAKVTHAAGLVTATCLLALAPDPGTPADGTDALPGAVPAVAAGIATLLGPTGGVERWGFALLSALEFVPPAVTLGSGPVGQLLLEADAGAAGIAWPELLLRHVAGRDAQEALARMFRALGTAARERAEFALEWFVGVGRAGRGARAVAGLWCAARLLEGAGGVALDDDIATKPGVRNKRLERYARALTKGIAEMWDEPEEDEPVENLKHTEETLNVDENHLVEHVSGLVQIRSHLGSNGTGDSSQRRPGRQPLLHKAVSLQLLAVTAGILQSRFSPLLLHAVYPILHSLVAPAAFLSSTALAALHFVARAASYASPANLLLANFDYALDGVARRLSRRWLDVDAARVLALLVRLVGRDVVSRARDVVEACFDRLDEYHGYGVLVEGLVDVLAEVVRAIEAEDEGPARDEDEAEEFFEPKDGERVAALEEWFVHRHDPPEKDETDYGPAPKEAWTPGRAHEPSPLDNTQPNSGEKAPLASDSQTKPVPTPTQALTTQIVARSMYFLTHPSPGIRARILGLLTGATPVLPGSALLPAVHEAWPFVLNRLSDPEPQVVGAAAAFVAALAKHVGGYMYRRVWDDVWPRFRTMLAKLAEADTQSALARRGRGAAGVGTESAYTHSHRLYRALLATMAAAAKGVRPRDAEAWQVSVAFRRFLGAQVHGELQAGARELYVALGSRNADAVWLVMEATAGRTGECMAFLHEPKWDIDANVNIVLQRMESE